MRIDKNQDKSQKIKVSIQFIIEFYKILIGCLLLIFVPQKCNENTCSINDILDIDTLFYIFTFYFNILTLMLFIIMYIIEINRENTLINYLEMNINKPRDNKSVEKELTKLKEIDKNKIINNRKLYDNISKIVSFIYLINVILSGINLYYYQLGSKTLTVFMTNIIFTGTKLYNIYNIVNSDNYIFYSAYITRRLQFNDIDPDLELKQNIKSISKNDIQLINKSKINYII